MASSEAAAPLLERMAAVYHEGCPGCGVDRRKALNLGVPYREFFHIWIIIVVSSTYYAYKPGLMLSAGHVSRRGSFSPGS